MYINSLAVQAIVDRLKTKDWSSANLDYDFLDVENSQDYQYVQEVTHASRAILQTTVELAEAGMLRYAPVRVFIRITSASIFLLKAISLGTRNAELLKSLDVLDHCIQALRSSTLDDIHLSSRYGMLIERHVARFRRNFRVQPKSASGVVARSQISLAPSSTTQFNNYNNNDNNNTSSSSIAPKPAQANTLYDSNNPSNMYSTQRPMDDLVLDDDWLTQPFDPMLAPFGLGADQTASGFEMDSLDFLWNLTA